MTSAITDLVLVVDKPVGPTSFDVVRRVRRAARARHVGHGGTLDPLASGVLPICLGEATKLAQFLLDADKEYEVTVCLGAETDTDDAAGAVTVRHDPGAIDESAVTRALGEFRGAIQQTPPAYSALKRAGRPAYDYARAGETVTLEPRPVVIHALELTSFAGPEAVSLRIRCSKGTYVRALARDLGRALGVGGHVTALRRTVSGPFSLAAARPLEEILAALETDRTAALPAVSLVDALGHLERRIVGDALARELRMGRRISYAEVAGAGEVPAPARLAVVEQGGGLVAVVESRPDGTVRSLRVFGVLH
jgi:tRNA pseudouridine55 synthase